MALEAVREGFDGSGCVVVRGFDRPVTRISWLESRHSFSFGGHFDPGNVGFGLLMAHNHDVLAPGAGYSPHPHRDMEIVTWVLGGALVHQDGAGHAGLIHPGLAQRMSAGVGIMHSERNDSRALGGRSHEKPVEFIQMWLPPSESGQPPSYEQFDVTSLLESGQLLPVISGMDKHHGVAPIRINQQDAAMYVARMPPGMRAQLPTGRYVHVYLARGTIETEDGQQLDSGDALRITGCDGGWVLAGPGGAELLVWEMAADLRDILGA